MAGQRRFWSIIWLACMCPTSATAATPAASANVQISLRRIAQLDRAGPALNSLIRVNRNALKDAQPQDRSNIRGPLSGMTIAVKDNIETFDMPTTAG